MYNNVQKLTLNAILSTLKRTSIQSCSKWSQTYRIMGPPFPGNWSYKYHPWLREISDSKATKNRAKKAAQMGFTEVVLNRALWHIDFNKLSVLYVLPAKTPDAADFSSSRFDAALELSNYLKNLFSETKNVGHKRAGSVNLFIRGSRARGGLKSIPTPITIFDELDEMTQENIPLAEERSSGQLYKEDWKLSTPTVPGYGISKYFENTTDEIFNFLCPSCNKYINLTFPESLVITGDNYFDKGVENSHLICTECKNILKHELKTEFLSDGIWIPNNKNSTERGWSISQMYSCTVKPHELAISYLRGMFNPADEQEFHNSKLGKEHAPEGSKITIGAIDNCLKGYTKSDPPPNNALVTIGVDVGRYLHYEVNQWYLEKGFTPDINMLATPKILDEGYISTFEELAKIKRKYQATMTVIDANPERRKAFEFSMNFYGRVYLCFYGRTGSQKDVTAKDYKVTIDRTSWLDLALSRFNIGKIMCPRDLSKPYKDMIQIPTRVQIKDKDGNPVARYLGEGDHAAHARVYNEIALPLAASLATNQDLQNFL